MELKYLDSSAASQQLGLPLSTKRSAAAASTSNSAAAAAATVDRIDWPRPKILSFIDDYRNLRVLWDANTKGYHMKQTKCEALKALSLKYGTEIRAIRSKIKSLRSSFHREHGKVLSNRRKGISYQPMWFAYEAIRFILDGSEAASPRSPSQQSNSHNNNNNSRNNSNEIENSNDDEHENDDDDDNNNSAGGGSKKRREKSGSGGGGSSGAHASQQRRAAAAAAAGVKATNNENENDDDVDVEAEDAAADANADDCDSVGYNEGELNAEEKLAMLLNDTKYAAAFAAAASEMGFGETAAAAAAMTMFTAANAFKGDSNEDEQQQQNEFLNKKKKIKLEVAATSTRKRSAASRSARQANRNLAMTTPASTTKTTTTTTSTTTTKATTLSPPLSPASLATTTATGIRAAAAAAATATAAHDNYAAGTGSRLATCFPKADAIATTDTETDEAELETAADTEIGTAAERVDEDAENIVARVAAAYPATMLGAVNSAALAAAANLPNSSSLSPRSAAATIFLNAIAAAGFSRNANSSSHNNNANNTTTTMTAMTAITTAANTTIQAAPITITTTTTTASTSTTAQLTTTPLDELTAALRTDLENDSQNYCNISADDVKTEIIESDSTEAMLMGLDQRSNEYRTNFFKNFELQQRETPKFYAPPQMQQPPHQSNGQQSGHTHHNRKRKYPSYQSQHQHQQQHQSTKRHEDALNLAKMQSHYLTGQARAQDLTTHSSGCAMTAIPAGIQLNPSGISKSQTKDAPKIQQQATATSNAATSTTATNSNAAAAASATAASTSSALSTISTTTSHVDEYGVFGEYVAMTIRKLKTTKAKIAIKHLINNLLYEGELGKYDHGIPASKEPPQLYKA